MNNGEREDKRVCLDQQNESGSEDEDESEGVKILTDPGSRDGFGFDRLCCHVLHIVQCGKSFHIA